MNQWKWEESKGLRRGGKGNWAKKGNQAKWLAKEPGKVSIRCD